MSAYRLAAVGLVGLLLVGCNEGNKAPDTLTTTAQKASYGIGLNIGRSLVSEGIIKELDPNVVALGIADALDKKEQRISQEELVKVFTELQKKAAEEQAALSAKAAEEGKAFLAENAKKEGIITTASGLQYKIVTPANGAKPKPTDVVSVHYEGRLINGTVFDSSIQRGTPVDLPVAGVIKGWVEALQLMHVGEKIELYIPSELAYGDQSPSPMIPANSVLIFDLQLLGIQNPDAKTAQ